MDHRSSQHLVMDMQRKSFHQLLPVHWSFVLRIEVASWCRVADLHNSIVAKLKLFRLLRHGGKLKLMHNGRELLDGLKRLSSLCEVACAHKDNLVIDMIKVPLSFTTYDSADFVKLPGVRMPAVGCDDYLVFKLDGEQNHAHRHRAQLRVSATSARKPLCKFCIKGKFGISPVEVTVDIWVNGEWDNGKRKTFNQTLESKKFWIYVNTTSPGEVALGYGARNPKNKLISYGELDKLIGYGVFDSSSEIGIEVKTKLCRSTSWTIIH